MKKPPKKKEIKEEQPFICGGKDVTYKRLKDKSEKLKEKKNEKI